MTQMAQTKVLLSMDTSWQAWIGEILTMDNHIAIEATSETPERLAEQFVAEQADVLFIEPGAPNMNLEWFRKIYEAMKGKPIVICSASYDGWFDFCSSNNLAVVVVNMWGKDPKYSYKKEIEEAQDLVT
jgi:hypothetical protein